MLLNIVTEPNEILHKKAEPVAPADLETKKIKKLVKNLKETMRIRDGVGLAAPQVKESLAICAIHGKYSPDTNDNDDLILINPTWEKATRKKEYGEEGCLSVPHTFGKVKRYKNIKVKALSPDGQELNFLADGFFARIIQHEVDHLSGIIFTQKAKNIYKIDEI